MFASGAEITRARVRNFIFLGAKSVARCDLVEEITVVRKNKHGVLMFSQRNFSIATSAIPNYADSIEFFMSTTCWGGGCKYGSGWRKIFCSSGLCLKREREHGRRSKQEDFFLKQRRLNVCVNIQTDSINLSLALFHFLLYGVSLRRACFQRN